MSIRDKFYTVFGVLGNMYYIDRDANVGNRNLLKSNSRPLRFVIWFILLFGKILPTLIITAIPSIVLSIAMYEIHSNNRGMYMTGHLFTDSEILGWNPYLLLLCIITIIVGSSIILLNLLSDALFVIGVNLKTKNV